MPPRLALPDVTLVCVDTRTPGLALAALQHCMAQVDFGAVLLFTDPAQLSHPPAGVTVVPLQIDSVPAYSHFMLRGLGGHIGTSHVLVVQWDGYLLDARQWDPAFLQYDYIGAPLRGELPARTVGNGGFSLRSQRLLLALHDPAVSVHHPEDLCICHTNRGLLEARHGLRFAPVAMAARFAYERLDPDTPTFGFHGLFNMHRAMPPEDLHSLLLALPDSLARGLDAHDLCRRLIEMGRLASAQVLLDKRQRLGMRDRRTWRLRGLLWWARQRTRWSSR